MYQYKYPHPAVTVDMVAFSIDQNRLKVLLIRRSSTPFKGKWALPGGFVEMNEDLDVAAARELAEETGIRNVYHEQLHAFGSPKRDPRERVITIAYLAAIPRLDMQLRAASDADDARWFDINNLPRLAFDHADILEMAQKRLTTKSDYSTIFFEFLPAEFTLPEVQNVFEIIRQQKFDKRNFRKWLLKTAHIEATGKFRHLGAQRPARLYRQLA